ncbi:MAG: DUF4595 domain-containing protein [Bacteroidales bacterium]|nr:DUF4595 domain-containing protein [Bacteroidales bacterium]
MQRYSYLTLLALAALCTACGSDEPSNKNAHPLTPPLALWGIETPVSAFKYEYDDEVGSEDLFYFRYNSDNQLIGIQRGKETLDINWDPMSIQNDNTRTHTNFVFNNDGTLASCKINNYNTYVFNYDLYSRLIGLSYGNVQTEITWDDDNCIETIKEYYQGSLSTATTFYYTDNKFRNNDGIYLAELSVEYIIANQSPYFWYSGMLGRPSAYLPDAYEILEYSKGDLISQELGYYSYLLRENGHYYKVYKTGEMRMRDNDGTLWQFYSGIIYYYQYKGLHTTLLSF